jgi:hypothetical protein
MPQAVYRHLSRAAYILAPIAFAGLAVAYIEPLGMAVCLVVLAYAYGVAVGERAQMTTVVHVNDDGEPPPSWFDLDTDEYPTITERQDT